MNRAMIYKKLQEIFLDIFELEENGFREGLSVGYLKDWDSLGHIRLMMAIEDEFDIQLSKEDFLKLDRVEEILNYLTSVVAN